MWISKKKYESLLSENEELKRELQDINDSTDEEVARLQHLATMNKELYDGLVKDNAELLNDVAYNFRIRRAVVGSYGAGKTVFIKKQIIPKLSMDYYVFDANDEYIDIPSENCSPMQFGAMQTKERINFIIETISENPHRLYIFESIASYSHDPNWFNMLVRSKNFNFIVVLNDIDRSPHFAKHADFFYAMPNVNRDGEEPVFGDPILYKVGDTFEPENLTELININ